MTYQKKKVRTAAAQLELARKAIDDPVAFLELLDFNGGLKTHSEFHFQLLRDMSEHVDGRRLILVSRGHLKSTIGTVLFALWQIYRNPDIRIMVACATKTLAIGFVRQIKQYLENVELQEQVWNKRPHYKGSLVPVLERTRGGKLRFNQPMDDDYTECEDKKIVWRADAIQVLRRRTYKEPTVYATSVGSSVTGWHFDLVIFDDIVTYQNSDTLDKAEKILEWTREMESVLNPYNETTKLGGDSIIIGTPYFEWDYYAHLLGYTYAHNQDDYEDYLDNLKNDSLYVMIRDIYGYGFNGRWSNNVVFDKKFVADGQVYMCPQIMNARLENKLRRRLGQSRFRTQYLVEYSKDNTGRLPISELLVTLNVSDIALQEDNTVTVRIPIDYTMTDNMTPFEANAKSPVVRIKPFMFIDPAVTISEDSDFSALVVGGRDSNGYLYILDAFVGRVMLSTLVNEVVERAKKWNLKFVTIETSGQQLAIKQFMDNYFRSKGIPLVVRGYSPKGEKWTRIMSAMEPLLMNKNLVVYSPLLGIAELKQELYQFPNKTKHDDVLDAMSSLYNIALPLPVSNAIGKPGQYTGITYRVNKRYGGTRG